MTGHRTRKVEARRANVETLITSCLATIEAACRSHRGDHADWYAADEPRFRLLTSLADGTDRIAVAARPGYWTHAAILPMPNAAYARRLSLQPGDDAAKGPDPDDVRTAAAELESALATAEQTTELPLAPHESDAGAYGRAADVMLRQIDLLVAVWDGQDAGREGSASDVVQRALASRIPVVWIAADRDQEPWLIGRMDDPSREEPMADARDWAIGDAVRRALDIATAGAQDGGRSRGSPVSKAATGLEDFYAETVPTACAWIAYHTVLHRWHPSRWRVRLPIAGEAATRADWADFLGALPDGAGFRSRLDTVLLPRFAAVDALATWYAHAYRSAYILAYLLSVAAVGVALLGLLSAVHETPIRAFLAHKALLLGIEIVLVGCIIWLVVHGGVRRHWHDRWLGYRALAEALRHLRILGPVGRFETLALANAAARPGSEWVFWYLRATMRELGLPGGSIDATFVSAVLRAVECGECRPQIDYHRRNAERLGHLHRFLHRFGDLCFIATGLLILVYGLPVLAVLVWGGPESFGDDPHSLGQRLKEAAPFVSLATSLLPALGATLAGIRFTGDFEGFAERSAETAAELERLRESLDSAQSHLSFHDAREVVAEAARIMSSDLTGWRELYGRKRLTLPA